MSLLSRNELRIVLNHQGIELLRTERKLTWQGYKYSVQVREAIPCEDVKEQAMPWSSAIKTLEKALPAFIKKNMEVQLILSNHFMQYTFVPWLSKLSEEEELVFARHCFSDVYGVIADTWSVRVNPSQSGIAAIACAVDKRLLDGVREMMGQMGLVIQSIQPHLMDAYNNCTAGMNGYSGWVVFLEADNLCLAVSEDGQLAWIKKLRIGAAWQEELATILQRESYMVDTKASLDEVLLYAPHLDDIEVERVGRWKVQQLKTTSKHENYGVQSTFVGV